MKTFKSAEVAPVGEMLERTLYVAALRTEIVRLADEHSNAIEHAAHLEKTCANLRRQLEAAQRWQPADATEMAGGYGACYWTLHVDEDVLVIEKDGKSLTFYLPDDLRLCRLVDGQPATGEGEG